MNEYVRPALPENNNLILAKVLHSINKYMTPVDTPVWKDVIVKREDKKNKENAIKISVCVTVDLEVDETLSNYYISEWDIAVLSAYSTLSVFNTNRTVSGSTIYHVITGADPGTHVNPEQLKAVDKSCKKMSRIHINIDCKEHEILVNGEAQLDKVSGCLLECISVASRGDNMEPSCYELHIPIIYQYASVIHQIMPLSKDYLHAGIIRREGKSTYNNTVERISVRYYILRRVSSKSGSMPNTILYKTLYNASGFTRTHEKELKEIAAQELDSESRHKAIESLKSKQEKALKGLRDFIKRCFDDLIELGVITQYTVCGRSRPRMKYYAVDFSRKKELAPSDQCYSHDEDIFGFEEGLLSDFSQSYFI